MPKEKPLNHTNFYPASVSPGYRIRQASVGDQDTILKIMDISRNALPNKSLFIADEPAFVQRILTHDGFGLLALDFSGIPAAYLLALFPGLSEENLGRDLCFQPDQLLQTAHVESLAVLPAHWGHHLQQSLISCALLLLDSSYPYLMATVSPQNLPSLKSFQACGFQIQAQKEKYNGHMRYILLKSRKKE